MQDLQKPSWRISKLFKNEVQRKAKRLRHLTVYTCYGHNRRALDLGTETYFFCRHIITERICQLPAVEQSATLPTVSSGVATTTEGLCCCPDWQSSRILYFFMLLTSGRQRLSPTGAQQVFSRYEVVFDMIQRKIGTSWAPYLPGAAYSRRQEWCQRIRGRRKGGEGKRKVFLYYTNNNRLLIK